MKKVIGITGGIGSGKSTVSDYLEDIGYEVIDADKISHNITKPNTDLSKELIEVFKKNFGVDISKKVVSANSTNSNDKKNTIKNTIDRKKLAQFVFSNKKAKNLLEKIITEKVIDICNKKIKGSKENIVFLDAPLLFECHMEKECTEICLVHADLDIRINRVMKRDNVDRKEVMSRIKNQMPEEEKIKKSDYILDNNGTKEELIEEVRNLLENVKL